MTQKNIIFVNNKKKTPNLTSEVVNILQVYTRSILFLWDGTTYTTSTHFCGRDEGREIIVGSSAVSNAFENREKHRTHSRRNRREASPEEAAPIEYIQHFLKMECS